MNLQSKVKDMRIEIGSKWATPTPMDSWAFLVTEVGELGDALLRLGHGQRDTYTRNNSRDPSLKHEVGDCMMMLFTTATTLGIDAEAALLERIQYYRKKYRLEET